MRALVQRVSHASVTVDGKITGKIDTGLLILLGIHRDDTPEIARWIADKCLNLRIFPDENGKFDRSLLDVDGQILVVSQFTLYGDCRRGRRPDFTSAAPPDKANALYEYFVTYLRQVGIEVETGVFGAMMQVSLCNDGPVTILVERDSRG